MIFLTWLLYQPAPAFYQTTIVRSRHTLAYYKRGQPWNKSEQNFLRKIMLIFKVSDGICLRCHFVARILLLPVSWLDLKYMQLKVITLERLWGKVIQVHFCRFAPVFNNQTPISPTVFSLQKMFTYNYDFSFYRRISQCADWICPLWRLTSISNLKKYLRLISGNQHPTSKNDLKISIE